MQDFNTVIIDFHDSFSYNISNVLLQVGIESSLINIDSLEKSLEIFGINKKYVFIL